MKVVITPRGFANCGLDEVERMRELGLTVDFNDTGKPYDAATFLDKARDADALIVGVDDVSEEVLRQCPNVRVVCKFGVGVDNIAVDYCRQTGIYVGRTVGSNSVAVAEMVMAQILSDARQLGQSVADVKSGHWNKRTGRELYEKTIGIVGFGAIGRHVARMARGFCMNVLAYDVCEISKEDAEKCGVTPASLQQILESADYVTLHVPLLDSTKDMIGPAEFAAMKQSACLVNASRGGVVDEEALYEALVHGEIRSACFDVWSSEPPAPDCPLLGLDNFMLTPHVGSRTVESEQRTCRMSTDIVLEQLGLSV